MEDSCWHGMSTLQSAQGCFQSLHLLKLQVAEGCNHACTFCAIPGFRGKFRSKPWDALLVEARKLVESGVVELNLIAEDTNQYGQDRCAWLCGCVLL